MGRWLTDDVLERVQRLVPIADRLGITMAQLALAWVLRHENVASAIVGASRPEQVRDNAAASGIELDAETRARDRPRLEPLGSGPCSAPSFARSPRPSNRLARCKATFAAAIGLLPSDDPAVIDAVWRGEALGTLLWALAAPRAPRLRPAVRHRRGRGSDASTTPGCATLDEIDLERESARLWHWRARTSELQADGVVELPERYATFDQLIAATAMRGFEQGLLPTPMRGDFRAYGKVYRHLAPDQHAEAHSIAAERQHALAWLCGEGDALGRRSPRHMISEPLFSRP